MTPAEDDIRAIPPPPGSLAMLLELLLVMVSFLRTIDPLPAPRKIPPPEMTPQLPATVLFWSSRVPLKVGRSIAPPLLKLVLLLRLLLRMINLPAVKPGGGDVLTGPE